MGRPPIKSTKKLIKAELETKAKFALSAKGIELAIVDMINRIDPLELLAVGASTFVVYDIIKGIPELAAQASTFLFTDVAKINPFIQIAAWIYEGAGFKLTFTPEQQAEIKKIQDTPDFFLFIKSFAIAYILVKHSGQIIAGVGNTTGFIASFLGLKAI